MLGCGELLAAHPGSVVIAVFAGIPANAFVVPDWDAACGFSSPQQAVTVRRREERSALEVLDAEPCWLACPESQYRRKLALDEVALRLARALRRHKADIIALPLGLLPGDHAWAFEAALRLPRRDPGCQWLGYDDSPPARPATNLEERLSRFTAVPLQLEPNDYRGYLKRHAIEHYESLQRGFFRAGRELRACLGAPERYWSLGP